MSRHSGFWAMPEPIHALHWVSQGQENKVSAQGSEDFIMRENVTFDHNFGGRSSATRFASVTIISKNGRVLHTVTDPSEFRVRENGTVTIYSRKHPSTSVYGIDSSNRIFMALPRTDATAPVSLTF